MRETTRQRPVPDDGDGIAVGDARQGVRRCKAECSGDGGGGVPHVKRVKLTLLVSRKAGEPARRTERIEPIGAPGHEFMHIALMPDVPDQLILWKIKHIMQSKSQLHHTQIGCQMAAGAADVLYKKLSDFIAERSKLRFWDVQQILSGVNCI